MEFNESILVKRTEDVKMSPGGRQTMTVHCQQCNTVLSDSFGVCGEAQCLDSTVCLKVTDDVIVGDSTEVGQKGEWANCIFSSLLCRGCHCTVGKVVHSAPSHLAVIRSLFLLSKANISCYFLNSSTMVKGSTVSFDQKPLNQIFSETKQQFEAQLDQISRLHSRLVNRGMTSKLDK